MSGYRIRHRTINTSHNDVLVHGFLTDLKKKVATKNQTNKRPSLYSKIKDKISSRKTGTSSLYSKIKDRLNKPKKAPSSNKSNNKGGYEWEDHKYLRKENGRYIYEEPKNKNVSTPKLGATEKYPTYNVKTNAEAFKNTVVGKKAGRIGKFLRTAVELLTFSLMPNSISDKLEKKVTEISARWISRGKSAIGIIGHSTNTISKETSAVLTGIKKNNDETSTESIERCNPNYEDAVAYSQDFETHYAYTQNCYSCAMAYDLRSRGYDVEAERAVKGGDHDHTTVSDMARCYPGAEIYKATKSYTDSAVNGVKKSLKSQGVGARGMFMVSWYSGGGHAMSYEVTKNGVRIVDTQTGYVYNDINDVMAFTSDVYYFRTDNLVPSAEILEYVDAKKEATTKKKK